MQKLARALPLVFAIVFASAFACGPAYASADSTELEGANATGVMGTVSTASGLRTDVMGAAGAASGLRTSATEKTPIAIEYSFAGRDTFIEGLDTTVLGDWELDYENETATRVEWDGYEVIRAEGDRLKVTYADGTSGMYKYGVALNSLYAYCNVLDANDSIAPDEVKFDTGQSYDDQWGAGLHDVVVAYKGCLCDFSVSVIPNPIASLEYKPASTPDFIYEGDCSVRAEKKVVSGKTVGSWTRYRYDLGFRDGDTLVITGTDGVKKTYEFNNLISGTTDGTRGQFMCNGVPLETEYHWISIDDDQSYENQWGVTPDNAHIIISYMGMQSAPVKVSFCKTEYAYNGGPQGPPVAKDPAYIIVSGTARATAAGAYQFDIERADGLTFQDGSAVKTIDWCIAAAQMSATHISLPKVTMAYTGKDLVPAPTVKLGSSTLKRGTDYSVSYKGNRSVGTATVTLTGKGSVDGSRSVTFKITKAANKVAIKSTSAKNAVKKTVRHATLRKKAQVMALPKVTAKFGKPIWTVAAKDKKGVLVLKAGKVVVKKGAKAGTYAVKLKAKVAGTKNYASAASPTLVVKVIVKK